jgi:MerR family transcriptional regulator, copper efflux regulator
MAFEEVATMTTTHRPAESTSRDPIPTPPAGVDMATMQIGAVAELTGMSLRSLRHYDDVGLVRPSARSEGGFRLYTSADVDRLLVIRRMKPLGFTLEEMSDLLDAVLAVRANGEDMAARRRLEDYLSSAHERRAKVARTLDMADEFIALLRDV